MLDPRSKIVILLMISVFSFSGSGQLLFVKPLFLIDTASIKKRGYVIKVGVQKFNNRLFLSQLWKSSFFFETLLLKSSYYYHHKSIYIYIYLFCLYILHFLKLHY